MMLKSGFLRAGALLAFFTVVGKLVGLWRDRILAGQFGASAELDVYYAAFQVPDLIFNLFILGATSSAIVPIFIEYWQRERSEAWRVAGNFLNVMFAGVVAASLAVMAFAGPVARLIGPGFGPVESALLADLMRIMLLSSVVFAVSTIIGSILHALQRFLVYALAPVFYNLGIIAGAVYLVPRMGIQGLAWGVVLGALLHLVVQLQVAWRAGFRFNRAFDLSDHGFRRMVTLMVPRTLALGAHNIGLTVITAIASLVGSGSITVINLATNLKYVPISVIGISMATAVFPQLSSHATSQELAEFKHKLNRSMLVTLVLTGLASAGIFLFRHFIIDIIFRVGAFDEADRALTASVLGIYMLSVVPQSLMHVITRAYYALQNTRTPFLVAAFSIVLTVWLAYSLGVQNGMGVRGIAIGTVIGYNANFFLLYILFRRRYF